MASRRLCLCLAWPLLAGVSLPAWAGTGPTSTPATASFTAVPSVNHTRLPYGAGFEQRQQARRAWGQTTQLPDLGAAPASARNAPGGGGRNGAGSSGGSGGSGNSGSSGGSR